MYTGLNASNSKLRPSILLTRIKSRDASASKNEIFHAIYSLQCKINIYLFFILVSQPWGRGGGIKPVGTKSQVFQKFPFEGSPNEQGKYSPALKIWPHEGPPPLDKAGMPDFEAQK